MLGSLSAEIELCNGNNELVERLRMLHKLRSCSPLILILVVKIMTLSSHIYRIINWPLMISGERCFFFGCFSPWPFECVILINIDFIIEIISEDLISSSHYSLIFRVVSKWGIMIVRWTQHLWQFLILHLIYWIGKQIRILLLRVHVSTQRIIRLIRFPHALLCMNNIWILLCLINLGFASIIL